MEAVRGEESEKEERTEESEPYEEAPCEESEEEGPCETDALWMDVMSGMLEAKSGFTGPGWMQVLEVARQQRKFPSFADIWNYIMMHEEVLPGIESVYRKEAAERQLLVAHTLMVLPGSADAEDRHAESGNLPNVLDRAFRAEAQKRIERVVQRHEAARTSFAFATQSRKTVCKPQNELPWACRAALLWA